MMNEDLVYWKAGETIYNFNDESDLLTCSKKVKYKYIRQKHKGLFINEMKYLPNNQYCLEQEEP